MKQPTRVLPMTDQLWPVQARAGERQAPVVRSAAREPSTGEPARSTGPTTIQLVGILAFGQSVLFLVLWLFLCASVGAAPEPTDWANPQLKQSTYEPTRSRDPFLPPGAAAVGDGQATAMAGSASLRLQGIVYDARRPSAMVNDEVLYVGKPVIVATVEGAVQMTAVEITREGVTLEVGGQRIELRLGLPAQEQPVKP